MYIRHTDVRGAGMFGELCPCGIEVVTPAQDKMLELFDGWYGDKSYRQHEHVIKWSDIHAQMIIDNMLASMSFAFEEKKEQEHEADPEGGGHRPHRHDDAADGGVQLAGELGSEPVADRDRGLRRGGLEELRGGVLPQEPEAGEAGQDQGSAQADEA